MASRSDSAMSIIVTIIAFIIGISLAMTEGYNAYIIGYSLLGSLLIFTIILDIIISIPSDRTPKNPSTELSSYLARSKNGDPPRFIKKIKESAF